MTSSAVRTPRVALERVVGDLFEISADALVNPWNRNYVPRSLYRPGGVSGQLRKRTGEAPWIDLARHGTLRVGQAVQTGPGDFDRVSMLIHVAGLHWYWRASARSVHESARSAVLMAAEHGARSMTMPLIGAGTGGLSVAESRSQIIRALERVSCAEGDPLRVVLVEQSPPAPGLS
ncbi:macro domain-containing protein [Plantibacter sp. VKM Ac-2880]|uniref:macro domain-containing protein n=1 Tax=Plantibacter sp. VKM Ac-2880 TaxID=2783827 RepID=UPI00188E5C74|nr:macro domain-containing protein [Plantibacter sp. VKM Ac-2880]MBF4570893.1 macro domain-containing protein [Plantibacter sp. VKM Ac-2880]